MYQMSDDDHAGNEKCAHADHRIMEINNPVRENSVNVRMLL